MSQWRPPAEWRTCADCPARFRVKRRDSPSRRCARCRWKLGRGGWGRTRAPKYPNTPASDALIRDRYDGKRYGRAAEIAKALGWPCWAVKRRAQVLGLTHPWPKDRKDWTEAEIKFLLEWTGSRYVGWIAKKLGRSITSCALRLKRLKISRRVREGYTLRALELCFGIDHHGIERWVREGRLRMERGIPAGPNHRWKVSEAAVFEFIWNHPTAFRLDKVDQPWFMGLMQRSMRAALTPPPEAAKRQELARAALAQRRMQLLGKEATAP